MDHIRRQSKVARRRLTCQRFLAYLPWTLLVAGLVTAVGLGLPKIVHLEVEPNIWMACWVGVSVLVALIVTVCLALIGRPTLPDAAAEIDRRFGMRERLSSALVLNETDKKSELGVALVADAQRRAKTVDVSDQFRWGFHRKLLVPLIPAVLVGLLCMLPDKELKEDVAKANSMSLTQVKNSTETLMQKIQAKRKAAEKQGLTAAVDMFKKLEGELAELRKNTKMDTKQAFAKLNDIKNQLDERRKELGDSDTLRKNLQNLKKLEPGPADELADAMKEGDFSKAEKALEELLEKMQAGEMTKSDMQKMQKQLEQLQNAMSEAAQAHEAGKESLKEQIKQAEQAGDTQKAAQLQRKLEQMQASDSSMAQMQELANMLSEASQSMQEGDMQSASEAFEKMAEQLSQMNASDEQLQELDELMDSLAESKADMMGDMQGMGQMPGQIPGNGDGQGEGQGSGERPEEEDDVDFYDAREREKMRMGETVYGGKVGGANKKGTTQFEVQEAVLTSMSEEPEPLDDTPLSKARRDHTRDYFNAVREGK